eukprot:scaffold24887_cov183-Skeletonema_marinoi.AAC.1
MQLSALKPKLVTQDSAMYDGNSNPQIDVDEDREGKTLTLALCREIVSTWSQEDRRQFYSRRKLLSSAFFDCHGVLFCLQPHHEFHTRRSRHPQSRQFSAATTLSPHHLLPRDRSNADWCELKRI